MKKTTLSLLSLVLIIIGFGSCGDNEIKDVYIPIKSVVATAPTSLDRRANWELYVNNNMYKSTVNGRTIHAQPRSEEEITYFVVHTDGGKVSVTSNHTNKTNISVDFISPNYHLKSAFRSTWWTNFGDETPELADQSTIEKITNADALSVNQKSIVTSHINNVKLEHSHCLIAYSLEGLPQGAKVTLLAASSTRIQPFVEDDVCNAILVNPHLASLRVQVGSEVHEVFLAPHIKKLPQEMRVNRDIHYSFVLRYDADAEADSEVLTIEDMEAKKWSADKFLMPE